VKEAILHGRYLFFMKEIAVKICCLFNLISNMDGCNKYFVNNMYFTIA
jgi:hypothetical protein